MFVFGTADDVFTMAVRIEENGSAFYAGAAERTDDPVAKKIFQDLALMEEGHITAFKALRSQLPASATEGVWDPEGLAESYLQAAADTHIFTVAAAQTRLAGVKTPLEAFDMAIQFEKDTIAFFLGMKEVLPDTGGRGEIEKLVMQEMEHVRMLTDARRQFLGVGRTAIV